MADRPNLRYAVACFDTWDALQRAVVGLRGHDWSPGDIACLGLVKVLGADPPPQVSRAGLRELPFPCDASAICCTPGPLAERLAAQLRAGASSLAAALDKRLIHRHAAYLERDVAQGRIVLWVEIGSKEEESLAYRALLATSSGAVGVHDLIDR